jgi:tetratricopeptide (TPR) repeat protein
VPAPEKPVAASAVPRRTGENQVDYDARVQRVRREYAAARAAIDKGELLDAISRLEAVQREQPNYLDSSKLLTDVQQRRRDEARRALDAATKAEESGALLDALPALERAKRYDPSPAVDERIARLHTRMKEEGARAYNDARKLDAFGKAQDAVGLYKRAISLLPADDDRRKDAARRVEALAK